jgi:hypothetical protein
MSTDNPGPEWGPYELPRSSIPGMYQQNLSYGPPRSTPGMYLQYSSQDNDFTVFYKVAKGNLRLYNKLAARYHLAKIPSSFAAEFKAKVQSLKQT